MSTYHFAIYTSHRERMRQPSGHHTIDILIDALHAYLHRDLARGARVDSAGYHGADSYEAAERRTNVVNRCAWRMLWAQALAARSMRAIALLCARAGSGGLPRRAREIANTCKIRRRKLSSTGCVAGTTAQVIATQSALLCANCR
jgi:hypothetical protein